MEVQLGREDIRFTIDSGEKRKASLLVSEESRGDYWRCWVHSEEKSGNVERTIVELDGIVQAGWC